MSNIILFPGVKKEMQAAFDAPYQKPGRLIRLKAFARGVLKLFQIFIILGWPIIRWFVYADLLFTFLRMLFHTRPQAGLEFGLHSGVFLMAAFLVGFCSLDSPSTLKKQLKNHKSTDNKRKRCGN
ncbi:TPA: KleE stable inheritance protein [Legionella pneumophila]